MTQQYQFTTADHTCCGAVNHKLSTDSKNRLDSVPHQSNTVRALAESPPQTQGLTGKGNMINIRLLNIDQVCQALNMGRCKVYELIHTNRLRTIKHGSRRLVSVRALHDCVNSLEIESHG